MRVFMMRPFGMKARWAIDFPEIICGKGFGGAAELTGEGLITPLEATTLAKYAATSLSIVFLHTE